MSADIGRPTLTSETDLHGAGIRSVPPPPSPKSRSVPLPSRPSPRLAVVVPQQAPEALPALDPAVRPAGLGPGLDQPVADAPRPGSAAWRSSGPVPGRPGRTETPTRACRGCSGPVGPGFGGTMPIPGRSGPAPPVEGGRKCDTLEGGSQWRSARSRCLLCEPWRISPQDCGSGRTILLPLATGALRNHRRRVLS